MASPFKHISQIKSLADFAKLTKLVLDKVGEDPVKVLYFPKFAFDKKEAPLLLVGDVPTPVLMEVKKAAGAPLIGQCSANPANQLVFEGAVKPAMARKLLAALGIKRVVASGGDEDEDEAGESQGETKTTTTAEVRKPIPVVPPKPPGTKQKLPVVETKPTTKPPLPPKPPGLKPTPRPVKKAEKPRVPKPGVTKEMIAAKDEFAKKIKSLYPLYQKALDTPGAPEAELQQLFKTAGEAAVATKYKEAMAALDKLEDLITEALQTGKPSGEAESKDDEGEDLDAGQFAKSRKAWQKAMKEASTSISALQAAVLKTKDPRAPGLAGGFKRILTKLPNPGTALEALAVAAEKKDAEAAEKHKTEALRLAKLCTAYLGSDKLVTLAMSNPFVPMKLTDHFKSALQTLQTELK